ncbi:RsbR, positive regulator of sigma-B [Enhygromyxa salina]|uniref:RsbR, positive regulator of sigma-B n=1 Tax=Enhygromyxa salina TaxID=215803 RepID=A0A0C1ZY06_9BACT|nr:STAS domain-containing protein [Enhygromyxa salina]KIG16138.1 RsbR, positive regulator of sigma-B [Enhygromyxa salina]
MADETLDQIASFIDGLAQGQAVEALVVASDDQLAKIAAGLNRLAGNAARNQVRPGSGGPADTALFARGPVVMFRWRNTEGWPVEFVSPNVEALTGYPVEEFASGRLPYASLILAEDVGRVGQEVADNSVSAEWFEHLPYRIRRQDGEVLWVRDYTVVLRDDAGAASHFYGYIMDITESIRTEELIRQQLAVIDDLGAPILQVWDGVLAVTLIGLLNEVRSERVTEALLERVATSKSRVVILDLTSVQDVDATTAYHLAKMVRAVGLLGCECVVSGVSPKVAQILVGLEVDFGVLRIYRTLAAALPAVVSKRSLPRG